MRILVTGGAGYIGSHAARELARQGHEVVIVDNLSTGHAALACGFQLLEGDIRDPAKLAVALRGVRAVVHFAAHSCVEESFRAPQKYFGNNVQGALVLLGAALEAGAGFFIHSSSAAVYGIPQRLPISEQTPRLPVNPYGVCKLAVESFLEAYGAAYGLRFVNLRYFNAAGADESGQIGEWHQPETHLIPRALQVAAGNREELEIYGTDYATPDGTCIRDYVHVSDLARAHGLALQYLETGGESGAFNLGSGTGNSILEIISAVESVTGVNLPKRICERRKGDPPVLLADNSRAERVLGWKPTLGLDQMVRSAWKWMAVLRQKALPPEQNESDRWALL